MSVSIHIEGTAEHCREQMQALLGGTVTTVDVGKLDLSTKPGLAKEPKEKKTKVDADVASAASGTSGAANVAPQVASGTSGASTPSTAGVSPEFKPVAEIIPLVVKKVGKPKLLEMLKKYGDTVTRGGELKPDQYTAFVADCQAVLAA